jgi:1,4-alpha-glucan branching enzyme
MTSEPPDEHAASERPPEHERETVRFGYFNPDAHEVFVAGTFNNWEMRTLPMERDETGNWSVELSLPPGEYLYRLVVDGVWRDHPGAARLVPSQYEGNDAVLTV